MNKKTTKKTVWLIEDEEALIDMYGSALKKLGFEIVSDTTGWASMDRIKRIKEGKEEEPDLLLLDLLLPDLNGIQLLQEIREHSETKDLPVFILTNYTAPELKEMGFGLQVEKYLLKTDRIPSKLAGRVQERLEGEPKNP